MENEKVVTVMMQHTAPNTAKHKHNNREKSK